MCHEAASGFNSLTILMLYKRGLWGEGALRIFLSYGTPRAMIDCWQPVCALIILIRFISINHCPIWQLIRLRLQGIHIATAARGKETFHRLPSRGDHQRNLASVQVSLLAGLIASKICSRGEL